MFQPNHIYTLEEYWRLVEQDPYHKYEYVDGHVRMMAGGSVPHGEIGANIIFCLKSALRGTDCRTYSSDVALLLTNQRLYYPDASVSCDPHDWTRKKAIEAPTVIVEVLSPTNRRTDLKEKLPFYQNYPTVQDILYVKSQKKSITHHYRRLPSTTWNKAHYTQGDDIIELASIEISLTVRDIYDEAYLELEE